VGLIGAATTFAPLPGTGTVRRRIRFPGALRLYASLSICGGLVLAALFPTLLTHGDPFRQELAHRLRPSFWAAGALPGHPLGTDSLGRDVLARLVYGARLSIPIAVAAAAAAGTFGTLLGLMAGYLGHVVDLGVVALADFMLSFPFMLTALLIAAVLGAGVLNLVLVLAVSTWPTYARIARADVMSVQHEEFITAARAIGLRTPAILRRHVLPNISASIIVIASLEVARLMIAEAFLSFLGVGIPAPLPSWGSMIADGRNYLLQQPWLATIPGLALVLSAIGFNLLGDALRDLMDPRLRRIG
jgi:peptide/nickel transport system permease protein